MERRQDDSDIRILADRLERFEKATGDQIQGLRHDMRESMREMSAALRVATDPESGYMPRSQVELNFERIEREFEQGRRELATQIDGLWKDTAAAREIARREAAHEIAVFRREVSAERDAMKSDISKARETIWKEINRLQLWVISTAIGIGGLGIAVASLFAHR